MKNRMRFAFVAGLLLAACGGDDPAKEPCPEGFVAGQTVACQCEDMTQGIQTCQPDGNLDACMCAPGGGTGGTTGATGGTTGGTGGTTGGAGGTTMSGGTGGSGGAGGTMAEPADGGMMEPADGGMMDPGTVVLPMDGNQGAVCESAVDCNMGLGCYLAGPGQGFCTATCMMDDECAALTGAEYTCSTFDQLCRVICMGEDDTMSCPENMVCVNTGGGGGGGGGAQFRCKYPEPSVAGSGEPWASCASAMDCADGLGCVGAGGLMGTVTGYCAPECTQNDECPAAPDTSTIAATCEPNGFMMGGVCALDCFGDADGCPEGMSCINNGFSSRCGY